MARKRRRGSVRSGSARIESRMLENVRYLHDHPEDAVPTCQGRCPLFCTFKRARSGVAKVHAARDDEGKLKALGRRGHPLARAYAAALRLALAGEGEVPYFQNVRTPHGLVAIAPWGRTKSLAHVGMQHRHDPALRLLAAVPFARPGEPVFASGEGLVCAHDGAPPPEMLADVLGELGIESVSPSLARCAHITDDWTLAAYVELSWPAAGVRLRVCEQCAQANALGIVMRRMVARDIRRVIDVRVQLPRLVDPEGGDAPDVHWAVPETTLRSYARGDIDDHQLIAEAQRARLATMSAAREPLVVLHGEVFRPPWRRLLEELDASGPERDVLDEALRLLDKPVMLERGTPVELLHAVWRDHGKRAVERLAPGAVDELYRPEATMAELDVVLSKLARTRAQIQLAAQLPAYQRVPDPADLADRVARALIVGGRGEAQRVLNTPPGSRHAPLAHALVQVLGLPQPRWTLPDRDRDFAAQLVAPTSKLLEARGDAYHQALVELLRACAVGEDPVPAPPG